MADSTHNDTRALAHDDLTRTPPPPLFSPGDPLPNLEMWVLVRKLGGGGFGEVWLARHDSKGEAAVKFCTDPKARHKLVTHERSVVARVMKYGGRHPNIVPLLECNLSGEIPWLMYELVDGGTLAEAVARWRELPPPRRLGRAARVLHAITDALARFHRLDPPLIHRDLKPQNILMAGNTPRITDFGIGGAALEAAASSKAELGTDFAVPVPADLQTAGSTQYAPPEQFLGAPPSPRDDVFALGVIAYQLVLADLMAIPTSDAATVLRGLRIPMELTTLIARSVALDPEQRPRDANEWAETLGSLVRKKTAARIPEPPPESDSDDATEILDMFSESNPSEANVSQSLTIAARGRWYARPAEKPNAEWQLVTTTPAEVQIVVGEVYRFSIFSGANEQDVAGIRSLSGLLSLQYLNLSFCEGVTDANLAHVSGFSGLRQLYLRGCGNISDNGLVHLKSLSALRTLDLSDCPQLTRTGIADLQSALPSCRLLK